MDAIPDIVDVVLYFLAALSVLVWTIAIAKFFTFRSIGRENRQFLHTFGMPQSLSQIRQTTATAEGNLARLGQAALEELGNLEPLHHLAPEARRDMLIHSMRQQAHAEQTRLENGLGVLASVGSTAPFIGLFGTVWGIMHALKNISATGSAGLDVVAGPIGEALIATAIGIATAIPAVLAYNYYLRKVKLAVADMEHFAQGLMHYLSKATAQGK